VTLRILEVLAVSQSKMEVEFGISLIIPAITCVAYFGRSNITNGSTILFMFTFQSTWTYLTYLQYLLDQFQRIS